MRPRQLQGEQIGDWSVISRASNDKWGKSRWDCRCICGKTKIIKRGHLLDGSKKSCGISCRPEGRISNGTITYHGYRKVVSHGHPNAGKRGLIMEHRLIMSELLGRPLSPNENVHHKNGDRQDNRPENLELWVTSQPSGQRPEDLIDWAKNILLKYGGITSFYATVDPPPSDD